MREAGYKGLTSQWDFIYRLSEIPPRSTVPVVSMHAYHAHPSDYISRNSTAPQSSVITSGCSMLRVMAPVRFIDRPYMVSEYGQVFWNRFRHEQGLAGSYAALQEWDLMMVHSTSVVPRGERLLPFHAGPDPMIRASDVVTAYAYLRGDVSPARKTVVFPVDDQFIFQGNRPFSAFNGNLAFLFAVSRVGLRYDRDVRADIRADLEVPPLGDASFNDFGMYGSVTDTYRGGDRLLEALAQMREKKLIGPENRTDPGRGLYQSDTGEITMDIRNGGLLDVVTPRLEGTTVKAGRPKRLSALTVETATCPASITVIAQSIDRTVESDDRLLAVVNTDALNSGMTFTDASRYRLVAIGEAPVLMQTGPVPPENPEPGASESGGLCAETERNPRRPDSGRLREWRDRPRSRHGPASVRPDPLLRNRAGITAWWNSGGSAKCPPSSPAASREAVDCYGSFQKVWSGFASKPSSR